MTTLFGLPPPVELSVQAFRRNLYCSLGELQIKADDLYNKYPFSQVETVEETRTERLYRRMLPNMTEYVIALLKVILASLPSSKVGGFPTSLGHIPTHMDDNSGKERRGVNPLGRAD